MANKKFKIQDLVVQYSIHLNAPPFLQKWILQPTEYYVCTLLLMDYILTHYSLACK